MTSTAKIATARSQSIVAAETDQAAPAFAELYRRHVNQVFYYLYSRVRDTHEAEDLTSQTFITALESFHQLRDKGKFVPWLFTIARNKATDHFRQQKRRPITTLDEELAPSALKTEPRDHDRLIELERLIQSLDAREQEYLRLRLVADLPFAQIAVILRQPETRIKKSYYRLLERLQAQVE